MDKDLNLSITADNDFDGLDLEEDPTARDSSLVRDKQVEGAMVVERTAGRPAVPKEESGDEDLELRLQLLKEKRDSLKKEKLKKDIRKLEQEVDLLAKESKTKAAKPKKKSATIKMAVNDIQEYAEIRIDNDPTCDDIKTDKKKIKMDHYTIPSWKEWLKNFLQTLTVSLLTAVLVSTVAYFTMLAQLQQKLSDIEKKNEMNQQTENRNSLMFSYLQQQINDSTDQVAVTACALAKPYSSNEKIQFPYIQTYLGVTDSVISSIRTTGIFKCEKPGLYFVSSFITTQTNGYYYLKKNSEIMAYGQFSLYKGYQTSTIVQLILLSANDTLSIDNGNNKFIQGSCQSSISILQLTG
ncbi:uncharacterized protein LOC127701626 [Mytilus californianus]|uniref:uncharacterized protein LOC127701626 n=1 Tax=Mytilus californianus TaxID=6549 RepID=UPI002247CA75|nr:uncharacterized protein LOC127701626 [Mytilus californianus]